jgi:hypothetical protein
MITVLVVLLLSTVGTATVMAKGSEKTALSCESPTMSPFIYEEYEINGILTYGTSSTPVPHRLITVYVSTDEKKWTEVGTVYTNDSGQYIVTMSQDTKGTYYYRAVFDGDKIFKKVTSPTISVTVNPLPGLTPISFVSYFELHNHGWFIVKLACDYSTDDGVTWTESKHTPGIWQWGEVYMPLDALGVPDRALVKIHVIVVGGKDQIGSTVFEYYNDYNRGGRTVTYYIYGTTLNPDLQGPYGVY